MKPAKRLLERFCLSRVPGFHKRLTAAKFVAALALLIAPGVGFAQVAPAVIPRFQFLDKNGKPLAGGKVFCYQAGTTTPQACYADSTGTVQDPNPLILDSGGFGNLWFSSLLYKIVVQDSTGAQQWVVDNVGSYNSLLTGVNANVTGIFTSSSANPATQGILRLAAGDCIYVRNASNSLDLQAICKDSNDEVTLGDTTGIKIPAFYDLVCSASAPAVGNAQQVRTYCDSTQGNQRLYSINGQAYAAPGMTLKKGTGGGNYTSASTTYARVDSTNLAFTVTVPTGWKLSVQASGSFGTATAAVTCNVALADGSADNTGILVEQQTQSSAAGILMPFSLGWIVTGDGNPHTINLQYKTSNGADSVTIANGSATSLPTMTFTLMPSN